ncbi:peptide/nickel transport system ATP-binding protein [Antricoccus suffuscus]|uniref:Peptide/nickel transport system ATP-binding protein n=1 Tax=Antricoccus suffuscus TaxID=1629062 RepID=A0A2T1A2I3_9ACTN|nr:ABC transporter ATP-binding protein [Antricoccus suffuscus]PRZ42820.1 peptide/nickel transport system ATP-binding protein [Antricoccus suffuscus]
MPLLDVSGFRVTAVGIDASVDLVDNVSFSVERGETLCIVGESGSGKTVTALSLMRLLEFTSSVELSGEARFDGFDLVGASRREMSQIRGRRVSMIFQECMEALNPTKRIGPQLVEAAHGMQESRAREKAADLLAQVGISDPESCLGMYPHQLSGGMQQRAMIAMSLMCDPELLIADEPTTALDVTIQAEILTLLLNLQRERNMAIILITHDMGIAAEVADKIAVMYAGRLVEEGACQQMLLAPKHPYTKALLDCIPRPGRVGRGDLMTIPGFVPSPAEQLGGCRYADRCAFVTEECTGTEPQLAVTSGAPTGRSGATNPETRMRRVACWNPLAIDNASMARLAADVTSEAPDNRRRVGEPTRPGYLALGSVSKVYAGNARSESMKSNSTAGLSAVRAVDDVSFTFRRGEFFCLVGESGSGKTTLGRLISRLEPVTTGTLTLDGADVTHLRGRSADRNFRRHVQVIFQDPNGSLDPRQTVGQALAEPLKSLVKLSTSDRTDRINQLLDEVNLPRSYVHKRPSELSGGQRQRVAIARAVATSPKLIVADEPTSALDVSVQGQIVNLLRRLQAEHELTYLFITHNLSLVLSVADRIGVMYLGTIVEIASAEALIAGPAHPYTQMLLAANPDPHNPRSRDERSAVTVDGLDTETANVDTSIGCSFRDRCPRRQSICDTDKPPLAPINDEQRTACHFPLVASRHQPTPSALVKQDDYSY